MLCPNCKTANPTEATTCWHCGARLQPEAAPAPGRAAETSTKALVALISGLFSFCVPLVAHAMALIAGFLALPETGPGKKKGRGLAVAGILLALFSLILDLGIAAIVLLTMPHQTVMIRPESRVTAPSRAVRETRATRPAPLPEAPDLARAHADLRQLAVALESYRVFEGRLPTPDEWNDATLRSASPPASLPAGYRTLTSPVSHIAKSPVDPFHPGYHYDYWTDGRNWIIRSYGPDGDADADLAELGKRLFGTRPDIYHPMAPWPEELAAWRYDRSRGAETSGDLIVAGP